MRSIAEIGGFALTRSTAKGSADDTVRIHNRPGEVRAFFAGVVFAGVVFAGFFSQGFFRRVFFAGVFFAGVFFAGVCRK